MSEYPFVQVENFRDLGGLQADGGRSVKYKRLLRCADISGLPEQDVALLRDKYEVRLIVDLRSPGEVTRRPDIHWEGVAHLQADLLEGNPADMNDPSNIRIPQNPDEAVQAFGQTYADQITSRRAVAHFAAIFQRMLALDAGAMLFHCAAGKDRTGVTAAVLLSALGVDRNEIIKDYLRTNEMRQGNMEQEYEKVSAHMGRSANREVFELLYYADARYLERAFSAIESFGGVEDYLYDVLGLQREDVVMLKMMYLD